MIQRKQSVYLFLAAAMMIITFFVPLGTFIGAKNSLVLYLFQVVSLVPDSDIPFGTYFLLPLLAPVVLMVIISFVTIFLYKNRKLQLILVRFMLLLILFYLGTYFFYYLDVLETASGSFASYDYGLEIPGLEMQIPTVIFIIPLISAALLFMASRGILNDEKLIRSADRLR